MSVNRQLEVLGISKGSYYYEPKGPSQEEIDICHKIDEHHELHPAKGVRQMRLFLLSLGLIVGIKKVRRLMRDMGIEVVYAKPNLSRLGRAKYVHTYLLRHIKASRPNHVWSTDITYVRMPHGHAYLYAIIDVYSRYIVGWGLYTTLDGANAIDVLDRAIAAHGKPEIINSDQGSQYTCKAWVDRLESEEIKISMDGRARCLDNIWIERFWHTIKSEYIYLHPHSSVADMRSGIAWWIDYYNKERGHSELKGKTPAKYYLRGRTTAA